MTTFNSKIQLALLSNKKPQSIAQKGFTLIELLVVVVIVGVLSSVALPRFLGAQENADKNASLTSTLGMAKECSSSIKLKTPTAKMPNYAPNKLVDVSHTNCVGTFKTRINQNVSAGELCVAKAATTALNSYCEVNVDSYGDQTGTWS